LPWHLPPAPRPPDANPDDSKDLQDQKATAAAALR
jgi:predicted small lipoprotein YifL